MRKSLHLRAAPVLLALTGACTALLPHDRAAPSAIFSAARGTWGWSDGVRDCSRHPQTIAFSPDWRTMTLTLEPADTDSLRRQAVYDVLGFAGDTIHLSMRGETRRDPAGDLVLWDLVLQTPDRFRWHRRDWRPGVMTKPLVRCPASAAPPREDAAP